MSQAAPSIDRRRRRYQAWLRLATHLQRLTQLHARTVLEESRKRQDALLVPLRAGTLRAPAPGEAWDYWQDFAQRSVLFWDALRQRGDDKLAYERAGHPLLLKFDYEVLVDGRHLPHPVNYSLLRIVPRPGQTVDDTRQPVVIIDPRGGHGAGIGGFKQDSEIGESLRAGHPTYFIAFSHTPEPEQTLADIAEAEARFVETVTARHPEAPRPILIGNCQAGWALMGMAAARPELPGLLIVAGAPLSYWAGVNGRNPLRYLGGLLGGSWMTRLGSDLGNGRFDGTWLVTNFESLNPANTFWGKYYQVFRNVDREVPRFLDFERWWGSPTLLNSEEIEAIVDELFIGNRLAPRAGLPSTGLDLRRIEAPVVVFCSYGDNITPPQQALDWIADTYPSDLALKAAGRTIVYLRHASIGHLGIFVSGKVAQREHREILGAADAIGALPPGLYELVIDDDSPERGRTVHFERRRIADITSRSADERDDAREFELVARLSTFNSTLYDWFVRPWMQQAVNEPVARLLRRWHPFRVQQVAWSSLNPALWWLPGRAQQVRQDRRACRTDNPLLAWETQVSNGIEALLDGWRDTRDAVQETTFHATYGTLSALTGGAARRDGRERVRLRDLALVERLRDALPHGGALEALVRTLFLLARTSQRIPKERIAKFVEHGTSAWPQLDPAALRDLVRLQQLLVFAHPSESLSTLPLLVPEAAERQALLDTVARLVPEVVGNDGASGEVWRRLHRVLDIPEPGVADMVRQAEAQAVTDGAPTTGGPGQPLVAKDAPVADAAAGEEPRGEHHPTPVEAVATAAPPGPTALHTVARPADAKAAALAKRAADTTATRSAGTRTGKPPRQARAGTAKTQTSRAPAPAADATTERPAGARASKTARPARTGAARTKTRANPAPELAKDTAAARPDNTPPAGKPPRRPRSGPTLTKAQATPPPEPAADTPAPPPRGTPARKPARPARTTTPKKATPAAAAAPSSPPWPFPTTSRLQDTRPDAADSPPGAVEKPSGTTGGTRKRPPRR